MHVVHVDHVDTVSSSTERRRLTLHSMYCVTFSIGVLQSPRVVQFVHRQNSMETTSCQHVPCEPHISTFPKIQGALLGQCHVYRLLA